MRVTRLGPIITPETHTSVGDNIQGPAVIRRPPWGDASLGRYLLYFADHKGDHIRLAHADAIEGPWSVQPGGCLSLEQSHFLTEPPEVTAAEVADFVDLYDELFDGYESVDVRADLTAPHIASPDVRVDEQHRVVEMWFHGLESVGLQVTRHAESSDGRRFVVGEPALDGTYLRVFRVGGVDYGLVMPGTLLRRSGGPVEFEVGWTLLPKTARHLAAWVVGDELRILYTKVGDAPERILMVVVDTRPPWTDWVASTPVEVLRPEEPWEGSDLPVEPSIRSFWPDRANQLRDPFVFVDDDASAYLFYAVAGESGIAVARLDG